MAAPTPTLSHRRPRVREVSSRFMSPVTTPSPSVELNFPLHSSNNRSPVSNFHRLPKSVSSHRRHQEAEPLSRSDENVSASIDRRSDTPVPYCVRQLNLAPRKQRAVKLFKENDNAFCSRTETPTIRSSLASYAPITLSQATQNLNMSPTAALKLLESIRVSESEQNQDIESDDNSVSENPRPSSRSDSGSDVDSTTSNPWSSDDCRSSITETDMFLNLPNKLQMGKKLIRPERSGNDLPKVTTPRARSMKFPLMGSLRNNKKVVPHAPKILPNTSAESIGGYTLPPLPPCTSNVILDGKKGKRTSSHQEDVHSLRLLHNHLLLWRFANAKAEACARSRRREAERSLYSVRKKISDLYNTVQVKRAELMLLKRRKELSTLLQAQMPYLDEWLAFEPDYSNSLTQITQTLSNASCQLPISSDIKADATEVHEALHWSVNVVEAMAMDIQNFITMAEETSHTMSELAGLVNWERLLSEECDVLLRKAYTLEVQEWSLRGQLTQLQRDCFRTGACN